MIKTALVFGGAYGIGSIGGAKLSQAAGFKSDGMITGTKIAVGVVAFFVLSSVLR